MTWHDKTQGVQSNGVERPESWTALKVQILKQKFGWLRKVSFLIEFVLSLEKLVVKIVIKISMWQHFNQTDILRVNLAI